MLLKGQIKETISSFIKNQNKEVVEDADKAIEDLAQIIEDSVFEAISNITITIPSGAINVITPAGNGTNPLPIILNFSVS